MLNQLQAIRVHVDQNTLDKLRSAVTRTKPVSLKLDLTHENPEHKILATPGQIKQIRDAVGLHKKTLTIRLSRKQVLLNGELDGGFLGPFLQMAMRFLPELIGAITSLTPKHSGDGMFLGRRGNSYRIGLQGEGLVIDKVPYEKVKGFYVKHDAKIYQGKGLFIDILKSIPILGSLF